jgi:hypothetical protein
MPQKLVTQIDVVDVPRTVYPRPNGVAAPTVAVLVATPERMAAWVKEIDQGLQEPQAFFGYNEADYLTVAQWLQDVLHFIKAQNAVIEAYENEAKQHNSALKKPPDDKG